MATMNIHEFELRYLSYKGLDFRLGLGRDEDTLIKLVKTSDKGQLEKSVPETSPDDLKRFTHETYTPFKQELIDKSREIFPLKTSKYSLADYIERLEYELKVIREMGFNSYFLIVSDYVRWAKRQMIVVGPGRGSGAGSLLAWAIEITDVDPMPFDLLFERFLNPARISMPDFDIDFEDTQRQNVINYCTQKYGEEKVCSIGTFMKMASKAAFKDAARAVGVPFERSNQVSNLIPEKVSLKNLIKDSAPEYEEVQNIYESDEKVKQAFDYAMSLEGNIRQLGVHACGIIIAPEAVSTYSAVQYAKENDHTLVSQYDGPTLEQIGLLKMDFLGLRNLSIIKNCIKIIKNRYEKAGKELPEMFVHFLKTTSFQPDITDEFTYDMIFKAGETTGIFQFESQ
jgi:DNA polymerase III, alpha subunit